MTTEHNGGSFRQIKKKAVKRGRLLANYRDLCLQLPLVQSDTSNIAYALLPLCTRSAFQCLCDFLSAGFLLPETLVDRYSLRSKAGTSFFPSQPSVAALTSRAEPGLLCDRPVVIRTI